MSIVKSLLVQVCLSSSVACPFGGFFNVYKCAKTLHMEKTSTDIDAIYNSLLRKTDAICEHCGHKIISFIEIDWVDCPNCGKRIDLK